MYIYCYDILLSNRFIHICIIILLFDRNFVYATAFCITVLQLKHSPSFLSRMVYTQCVKDRSIELVRTCCDYASSHNVGQKALNAKPAAVDNTTRDRDTARGTEVTDMHVHTLLIYKSRSFHRYPNRSATDVRLYLLITLT